MDKWIKLPGGTLIVAFPTIASLIADALYPGQRETTDWLDCESWAANELMVDASAGRLKVRNPISLGEIQPAGDLHLLEASVVTVEDLRSYVAGRGISVVLETSSVLLGGRFDTVDPLSETQPASGGRIDNTRAERQAEQTQCHVRHWSPRPPQRIHGYTAPLFKLVQTAHQQGRHPPTAREALEAFRANRPDEIPEVLPDGIKYFDKVGNTKVADIEAIRKAIARMIGADKAD
jgi:hypothetical protein